MEDAEALVYLRVFDLPAHPGQWMYLGAYIVVLAIGVPTVVFYHRARRLAPPPPLPTRSPGIPAPRPGVGDDVVRGT